MKKRDMCPTTIHTTFSNKGFIYKSTQSNLLQVEISFYPFK